MTTQEMKVTYQSPATSEAFSRSLPSLPRDGTERGVQAKTAYLACLRTAIGEVQGEVNTYLTQRMDLEKASQTDAAKANPTKEEVEEERYGEEDLEADS